MNQENSAIGGSRADRGNRPPALRILMLLAAATAFGHVGSPDVFLEGNAGPYPVFVTIRPPSVIPGIAEIEIRCPTAGVSEIHLTPIPLTGPASKLPPVADVMQRSKLDPQFFTGTLWLMATGSWQVRVRVDGSGGSGELSVPVPAVPTQIKSMQAALGGILFVLMLVLAVGAVSIVGASAREAQLEPGKPPVAATKSRARILMTGTAALVVLILWGGERWWSAEASSYSDYVYRPLGMKASVELHDKLVLTLKSSGWLQRRIDDFLPDHGHLMHLYLIQQPDAARVWHIHPDMTSAGIFTHYLPPMPAGKYKLYGDVVHRDGLPETLVTELNLPNDIAGTPISGDDAAGVRGESPDGARIEWVRDAAPIKAKQASLFKFRLVDKSGKPVEDAELYMGMLGHAAFLKNDGTVFAHVHPSGSVPMAALELANPEDHTHMHPALRPEADFPYGFPNAGDYRVIVQMKHAGIVETAIFDAKVE